MARRHEGHADIADPDLFAIADGLRMSRLAITRAHDGERLRRGEHMAVAAARMVRMAVGDERAFRRKRRIDPEIPGRRSEEHTSELQSLMRNSSAGFRLKKKK